MFESADVAAQAEILRLNKVVQALMNRAERSTNVQGSAFSLFQTAIVLDGQVRRRTAELEAALHENERVARDLRESEQKFRGLVEQSFVGIAIIDNERFSYVNGKFAEIFGYTADELRGMHPLDITAEEDRARVIEQLRQRLSGEAATVDYAIRGRRKDGTPLDIELHGAVMELGGKRALITVIMDITERVRAERELQILHQRVREQAAHDPLSGLYNRQYLNETFAREISRAQRSGRPLSVVMFDLDHFKAVNDRYGHLAGDEVLKAIGSLLHAQSRAGDICCRYGGEEFLLLLPEMNRAMARDCAERLRMTLAGTAIHHGDGKSLQVTASFGVAVYPQDGSSSEALIAAADAALYAAKAAGRNRVQCATEDTAATPA